MSIMRKFVWIFVGAVAGHLGVHAQDAALILSSLKPGSNALDLETLNTTSFEEVVIRILEQNLAYDAPRLVIMHELPAAAEVVTPKICGGTPGIVVKSKSIPSNKGCFKKSVAPNSLSCTCIDGYDESSDTWEFKLSTPVPVTAPIPTNVARDKVYGVSSLLLLGVPAYVKTLKLLGQDNKSLPLPMELRQPPFPGMFTDIALLQTTQSVAVTTLIVENLDLSPIAIKPGFVPSTLKKLTMKNCKLQTLSSVFLDSLDLLQSLDVSMNQLEGVYQGATKEKCLASPCPLKELNVTDNLLPAFPTYLFVMNKLQSLSLKHNPFRNLTVDQEEFEMVKALKTFECDATTSVAECTGGEWKTYQTNQFCLKSASAPQLTTVPAQDSNGGNVALWSGIIVGCLIIVVLFVFLVRQNVRRSRDGSVYTKEPLDDFYENTLSYEDTHSSISASLLNDPIIITNRIPYKDIKVANCISKGGFGLIYSGVYQRRRVAIKKIRPDRAGDIQQIQLFLKEICLMATLDHPRIVEFVGVAWDSLRNLCAVTEFMERGDLRDVLNGFKVRNQLLTWENHKTKFALQIAEALVYLHSLKPKVIHRDLKSKNVLVNVDMDAKLSDFGISRERRFEETHMTAGIGTSFWIAPEVLLGRDYDEHADIFSFGVVLSEIDTDDYPYWNAENPSGGNQEQNMILQMVASGAMRPAFTDNCPKEILELANLCLQVDPESRPSAAEIVFTLQQLIHFTCFASS